MPALEHRTVAANGLEFAYLEEGQGQLVLLLHGFPDTAHTWDRVRPALAARGYRAVSPFLRGYPPTSIPADGRYDTEALADDVVALIDALGGGPAIVVAHDWGAGAAYAAAGKAPDRIRKLVTVALPHPAAVPPAWRVLWGARHFFTLRVPGAAKRIRAGGFAHIDELVQRWSPGWAVPEGETAAVKRAFAEPGGLEAAIGYYRAMSPILSRSQRARISVPTVAIAALDDGILVAGDYERARTRFTGSYRVIPMAGGHFLHRQHPEQFLEHLFEAIG